MKLRSVLLLLAITMASLSPLWADESSAIRSVRYAAEESVLTITFVDGSRYTYAGVPAAVAEALEKADSKGDAFNQLIKGKYTSTKVVLE